MNQNHRDEMRKMRETIPVLEKEFHELKDKLSVHDKFYLSEDMKCRLKELNNRRYILGALVCAEYILAAKPGKSIQINRSHCSAVECEDIYLDGMGSNRIVINNTDEIDGIEINCRRDRISNILKSRGIECHVVTKMKKYIHDQIYCSITGIIDSSSWIEYLSGRARSPLSVSHALRTLIFFLVLG